ncbi:uncharacterized protein LOC123296314 [Chrysoperla carnea]|uniref:uncharacterized protein LOC123296314 n=1 Tax=Chrysoperla carnea TaxID=189513 RepID=UPI001D07CECA|nr:uncharacterized protein LOC123296314 [Chrysoperla carnea]
MESWPLIKKNANLTCGDVTHVVRETFRDFFNENITNSEYTANINCPVSHTELQNCTVKIKKVFEGHQRYVRDIQEVEQIISKDIEQCIERDKFIKENVIASANMKLRKHPVFKDIDPGIVQKYNLIQSDDLLPTPIERITDYAYDYNLRNHYKKHLESNTYGSLIHCNYTESNVSNRFGVCPVKLGNVKKDCFENKRKKLDAIKFPSSLKTLSCGTKGSVKKEEVRLKAEPESVLFYDYKINVPYEHLVKIRNIAGSITRFNVPIFNHHSKFKIVWKHLTTSLTPGMCVSFIVQFFTQTYDDTQSYLQFRVKDGKDLIIKLISKRPISLLTGVMFYGSSCMNWNHSTTTQINKVLNSTIECKQCLIGRKNEIILSFCKCGADASYFLISEYSWYNMVVNEINTNLEIKLPPFTIHPAYFTIKSNEIIDIHIEFAPQEFGLHLNKLIVICDNCTYDYLDLVGDGVYFQPDFIKIQASEKDYSVIYDSDYESKYVLNLGNVLTFRKSSTFEIYVTNKSILKFNYRWELRAPDFKMNTSTALRMNPKWIKLTPLKGRLNRETDSKFTISVFGNSYTGGSYRYVIEQLVDILIGEIELWLNIDEASIMIDPCSIIVYVNEGCQVVGTNVEMPLPVNILVTIPIIESSTHILNFGYVKYSANVAKYFRISSKGIIPLKWYITEYIYDQKTQSLRKAAKPSLNIYHGILDDRNGMKCDLEYGLWTGTTGKWCSILIITTKVGCEVQGTDFVLVYGEILAPLLNILAPPAFTATLRTPINYINVKKFYSIYLRNISSIKCSYTWDRPEGRDVSKLELYIWPLGGIIQPMTTIKLYVVLEPKKIGDVTDFHVPCFVGGNLEPLWLSVETTNKDISVLIYHPYRSNPHEYVEWPPKWEEYYHTMAITNSDEATTSITPTTTSNEIDLSTISNKSLSYHKSEESLLFYDPGGTHIDWKFTTKSSVEQQSDLWSGDFPSSMSYTTYSSRESFISLAPIKKARLRFKSINSAEVQKQLCTCEMELRIKNINLRRAHKRTVLIKNQTPILGTYRVSAKNFAFADIKIPVDFIDRIETELSNKKGIFKISSYDNTYLLDRWTHHLNKTCVGFILHIEPKCGRIQPNDYITFDIWIYGDTWGTYQDEIIIEIERQSPFKINLIVDIIGQPIIFPMLCDNAVKNKKVKNVPIVRFGSMAYESESITRRVKVKNISAIDITLVWHVYLHKHNGHRKDEHVSRHQRPPPLNLALDLFDAPSLNYDHDNFTRVQLLLTKFWGDEDSYIFRIHPKEMKIKPQTTDVLEITFNPQEFHPIWGELKIEAYVIGHVKISEKNRKSHGVYHRKHLHNMNPTKIKLEATLLLPLTNLQLIQGDIKFKVFAATVMSQFKRMSIHRTFLMQNNNNVPINARLHIHPPFKIIEVKTKGHVEKTTKNKIMNVNIDPGLCAEILLKCSFSKKFIQEVSENVDINVDKSSNYSISNKTVIIPHELIIEQPNLITQRVPLEIIVIYPNISISTTDLDFGPVSVGYKKTLTISVTNRTCSDIEFSISKTTENSIFTVEPLEGIMPKVVAGRCYRFDIDVTFVPLEIEWYLDTIVICVGKTNFIQDITLSGNGTVNLRYA